MFCNFKSTLIVVIRYMNSNKFHQKHNVVNIFGPFRMNDTALLKSKRMEGALFVSEYCMKLKKKHEEGERRSALVLSYYKIYCFSLDVECPCNLTTEF